MNHVRTSRIRRRALALLAVVGLSGIAYGCGGWEGQNPPAQEQARHYRTY